ncbi:ABC transporter substrate-binding protein [Microlunatus sp. Y2014]|uniref:ABC transporter substrate-binding protein n=1 Tax=Microlunatus sp. Y2014 TaxID=3418488 RepID=UPI003DA76BE2
MTELETTTTTSTTSTDRSPTRLSRRGLLGAAAATAIGGGLLSACQPEAGGSNANTGGRKVPIRVWTVPEGPDDEKFQTEIFEQFNKDHTDVEVELQFFPPPQYGNALQLAFTGGQDAPDVFRVGGGARLNDAHPKGWVAPLDDFITDEFKARFPSWVYDPEQSPLYRDGSPMAVPRPDPFVEAIRVLYCNEELLTQAGFSAPPKTWGEFAEMTKKITADSGGRAYGGAIVGNTPNHLTMAALAGPQGWRGYGQPLLDLLTGKPAMAEPGLVKTIEFWQDLHQAGALTPGWESWDATQAIQQMAAGRLAMYTFPLFHTFQLRDANPDLKLVLAPPPDPDEGRAGSVGQVDAAPFWMMSTACTEKEAAWQVLDFFGSVEFQQPAFVELQQMSLIEAVYEGVEVGPDVTRLREIADDIVRAHPQPDIDNPAVGDMYNELVAKGPKPNPREVFFEAITKGSDYAATAEAYDTQISTLLETLLPQHEVTADDLTFADWDPMTDYFER